MHGSGQRPDLPDHIPRSSWAEKTSTTRVTGELVNSNDENSYVGRGNRVSSDEEVVGRVSIPFYAPHLLFQYSKLVNKTEENSYDDDDDDDDESEEEVVPSEVLDLTGDLISHLACLDHVRWWNSSVFAPPGMMGPPPPPPSILLSMIASELGTMNGVVPPHPRFYPSNQMFMTGPPFVPSDQNARDAMPYFQDTVIFKLHLCHVDI